MKKDIEWFEKQIKGLLIILEDTQSEIIARSYIKEKLNMILRDGINFHPLIKEKLK